MRQVLTSENLVHLKSLIAVHKRRLYILEGQAASHGIDCPVHIITDIEDTKAKIESFEQQIRNDVIGSYDEGRGILDQFTNSIQGIEQNLRNAVIKERRVFRIFGVPVWSLETSRVINLFIAIVSVGIGFFLGGGVVPRTAVKATPTLILLPTGEAQTSPELSSPTFPPATFPPSPPTFTSTASDNSANNGAGGIGGGEDCDRSAFVTGTDNQGLRVRTLPSQNGQVLVTIPEGSKVTLQCQELRGWLRLTFEIQDGEVTGWVDARFVQPVLSSTERTQTSIAIHGTATPLFSTAQKHLTTTPEFNLNETPTLTPTSR